MSNRVVECPGCESKLRFKADSKRTSITCPRCGQKIAFTRTADPDLIEVEPEPEPTRAPEPRQSRRPKQQTPVKSQRPRKPATEEEDDDIFGYFGVDEKPTQGKPRRKRDQPDSNQQIRNRRERKREANSPSGKKIALLVAALAIPFMVIGGGVVWYLTGGGDKAQTNESVAGTQPADTSTPGSINPPQANVQPEVNTLPVPPSQEQPANNDPPRVAAAPPPNANPRAEAPPPKINNQPNNPKGNGLEYRWKAGDKHYYSLTVIAGNRGSKRTIRGSCTYDVRSNGMEGEESEGSGTGFCIARNGYIATCAHVIEGARRIEVMIGQKAYRARVVVQDDDLDLAIIRIDRDDLTVLPIGDSDKVQLSEHVRAYGFPLSSLLGTEIKSASGEVAGRTRHPRHGDQIQVDAPINPGNSGGPVLNDFGQVIGVASMKLDSRVASSVGMAVPINELKQMIVAQGLNVPGAGNGQKLDGPTLANRVTPGVFYIKSRGSRGGKVFDVRYTASYSVSEGNSLRVGIPSTERDSGSLKVNSSGEVIDFKGKGGLPFVLGPISHIFLEPVDSSDKEWGDESEGSVNVIRREKNDPFGFGLPRGFGGPRFGSRFGGPRGFPGNPFGQQPKEKTVRTIPAVERVNYTLGQELNNRVSIRKKYEFVTTDHPQRPYLSMKGSGDFVFDRDAGMPNSLDFEATIVQNDEDGRSITPLSVKFVRRDPAEVKRERDDAIARNKEVQRQREEKRNVPNADRLEAALTAAKRKAGIREMNELAELAVVPEKRKQVLAFAKAHLRDSSSFTAGKSAEIYARWSTNENIAELKKIAMNRESWHRNARKVATRKLIEFDATDVFPDIIKEMDDSSFKFDLKKILIAGGEKMEQPILDTFDQIRDSFGQQFLVEVLGQIGTAKSKPLLEKLSQNRRMRFAAERALRAIRGR